MPSRASPQRRSGASPAADPHPLTEHHAYGGPTVQNLTTTDDTVTTDDDDTWAAPPAAERRAMARTSRRTTRARLRRPGAEEA